MVSFENINRPALWAGVIWHLWSMLIVIGAFRPCGMNKHEEILRAITARSVCCKYWVFDSMVGVQKVVSLWYDRLNQFYLEVWGGSIVQYYGSSLIFSPQWLARPVLSLIPLACIMEFFLSLCPLFPEYRKGETGARLSNHGVLD